MTVLSVGIATGNRLFICGTNLKNLSLKEDKGNYFMYPERPIETTKRKELPPLGLKIFKGEREMTMSRYEYEYLYFIVFFL